MQIGVDLRVAILQDLSSSPLPRRIEPTARMRHRKRRLLREYWRIQRTDRPGRELLKRVNVLA